ncbi:peptide-methionine (S)-S-oxide reductase MsrA [Leuconostoc sp. JNUCC 76]
MKLNQDEIQRNIYNLILNPATRDWERQVLIESKNEFNTTRLNVTIDELKYKFKPLAVRNNLTPDVMDFYLKITDSYQTSSNEKMTLHHIKNSSYQELAIFAGGCFWCMVEPFDKLPGIKLVVSGYIGGTLKNPTYDQVLSQHTGHVEAVEILFDNRFITYEQLINIYWLLIDPTDNLGQVEDRGENYKPIIFVNSERQRYIAEKSKQSIIDSHVFARPIVVEIKNATKFWPAENYHQDFYKKNPRRYHKLKRFKQVYLFTQRIPNRLSRILKKMHYDK